MSVGAIGAGHALPPLQTVQPSRPAETGQNFSTRMETALNQVNDAQARATQSARAWETGQETDLAAVMVEQQVASLGFQLTLNVRNKALGAYRDIMNMPV
jgi:flagellar hook-basal body complex protein FliE